MIALLPLKALLVRVMLVSKGMSVGDSFHDRSTAESNEARLTECVAQSCFGGKGGKPRQI